MFALIWHRRHRRITPPLSGIGPFQRYSDRELREFTWCSTPVTVDQGRCLAREGRVVRGAYVVAAGTVHVTSGDRDVLAGPGSVIAHVRDPQRKGPQCWRFTAVALERTDLIEVTRPGFTDLVASLPGFAERLEAEAIRPLALERSSGHRAPATHQPLDPAPVRTGIVELRRLLDL